MRCNRLLWGLCVVAGLSAAVSAAPLVYERFEDSAVGTIVGGVTFSTDTIAPTIDDGSGPVANQYTAVFDGASGTHVTHGATTQVTSTSFTVEAFIRLPSGPNWSMIASDWKETGPERSWSFIAQADGALRFDVSPDGNYYSGNALSTSAGVIQADKWYHVAGVSDGQDSRIYLDGIEVASKTRQYAGIYTADTANLKIGNVDGWGGSAPRPFNGSIDELRIDNGTALTRAGFIKSDRVRAWVQAEDGTPPSAAGTVKNTDAGPDATAVGGVIYSADVASPRVAAPDMIHRAKR